MSFFEQDKVLVIAEAGKNFIVNDSPNVDQCLNEAKNLARLAKRAGADYVKYQTHVAEDELHKRHEKRHAWIALNESVTPYEEFWKPLKAYCDEIGIGFMTSPMSKLAAQKVEDLVTVWKVGSGDTLDWELLEYLGRVSRKPVIISVGMTSGDEVEELVERLDEYDIEIAMLQCTSLYPCPVNKLHLSVIPWLHTFVQTVGFSDHSTSTTVSVLAIEKGARIIEKHFTIDKTSSGPDHAFALDFHELCEMVQNVRRAEERLFAGGESVKRVLPEEEIKREIFRKKTMV